MKLNKKFLVFNNLQMSLLKYFWFLFLSFCSALDLWRGTLNLISELVQGSIAPISEKSENSRKKEMMPIVNYRKYDNFEVKKIFCQKSRLQNTKTLNYLGYFHAAIIVQIEVNDDNINILFELNHDTGYTTAIGTLNELRALRTQEINWIRLEPLKGLEFKAIIDYVESIKFDQYYSITNNCIHFAEALIEKFTYSKSSEVLGINNCFYFFK